MPPATRKPAAKKTAAKTATPRKRGTVALPKPPAVEPVEAPAQEEVPAVSETTETTEAPKRGRKPNVVGQANSAFLKAVARLDRAKKKAAKVQSVQDELNAAQAEYDETKAAYETAFRASLGLTDDVADDSADEDGDE